MTPRIAITLAIIAGVAVGAGAICFGVLELAGFGNDKVHTLIAVGAMLLVASTTALAAHLLGGFRDLDGDD